MDSPPLRGENSNAASSACTEAGKRDPSVGARWLAEVEIRKVQ